MSGVQNDKPPWQQPDRLDELYNEKGLTTAEVAGELGCAESTASWWLRKLKVKPGYPEVDIDFDDLPEKPWQDPELMEQLYIDEGLSGAEIAMVLDCSTGGVAEWIDRHDFESRTASEAAQNRYGSLNKANFNTSWKGYEYWAPGNTHVYVHRLMMVAEHGFDEVCDKHVHHRNGIEWDNRFDNLELVTNEEHRRHHLKVPEEDREKIADEYEHTDKSSYTLADEVDHDISAHTVREIHGEYYE